MLDAQTRVPTPPARRIRSAERPVARRNEPEVTFCAGMHRGFPAILAVADGRIFFAWVPSGVSRRRDIPIRQVMAVEETTRGRFADLTVFTSHATVVLTDVTRMRAWQFCRRVREAILVDGVRKPTRQSAAARANARGYERRPYGPNQPDVR